MIYEFILSKGKLTEEHRKQLKENRGFSDETINTNRFISGGNYLVEIEAELSKFPKEELITTGVCIDNGKGIAIHPILLEDRIIIPYLDKDNKVVLLRPHKLGLKNVPIQIYQEKNFNGKSIILTEGEFKAAAACQLGFPAIAIPGISSFSDQYLPKLVAMLNSNGVRNVWIIFDNEVKDDPKYKDKYKENPANRHDTTYYAYYMAKILEKEGFNTRIGTLPDGWRVNGKIDIDGALTQNRTKEDFTNITNNSKTYREYSEDMPEEVKEVFKRKDAKKYFRSHIRKEFNRYVVSKKGRQGQEYDQVISNFTLRIVATHETPEEMIRSIQLTNEFGNHSKFSMLAPEDMNNDKFKTFCFAQGNYVWEGSQDDLTNIWKGEFLNDDGRHIVEPDHVGWVDDDKMWLFANVAFKDGKEMRPDAQGIFWTEKKGYKPIPLSDGAIVPYIAQKAPSLQEILKNLGDTMGEPEAKISLGWILSIVFMEEVFQAYSCFPFLFLQGLKGSGKSHIADWLMAFWGLERVGQQAEDSTQVGLQRRLGYYSSLPVFIDEYRNTQKVSAKNGFFRNCHNRQSASKGIKSNFGIRTARIRGTILFAGEETPADPALLSRCIPVTISLMRKKKDHFDWFSSNLIYFSYHMFEMIRNKSKLLEAFKVKILEARDYFREIGMDERMSMLYSVPAAGYCAAFGDDDIKFAEWMVEEVRRVKQEQELENSVSTFFEDVLSLKISGMDMKPYFEIDCGKIYISFHSIYNEWSNDYRRRKGEPPFKESSLRGYVKELKGYIGAQNRRVNGGAVSNCTVFDAEVAPGIIGSIAEGKQ